MDVRQIEDKFPDKSGGLKELYSKGPQDAFYLVKFWADLNTNINDESSSFYDGTKKSAEIKLQLLSVFWTGILKA